MTEQRDPVLDLLLRRPEPRWGLLVAVILAVLLHVVVVPGAGLLPPRVESAPRGAGVAAWVGLNAAADHRRLEIELRAPAPTAPPAAEAARDPLPTGQVVKLPARERKRPHAADFLAEEDQSTDHETRARITGVTETTTRRPQTGQRKDVEASTETSATTTRAFVPGDRSPPGGPQGDGLATNGDALAWDSRDPGGGAPTLALQIPTVAHRDAFDAPVSDNGIMARQEAQDGVDGNGTVLRVAMGGPTASTATASGSGSGDRGIGRAGGSGDGGLPSRAQLLPSLGTLERLAGLPANDALLVEEGDETALNTFEYKHATFFNRVADAIRREWDGGAVLARSDPGGEVYGFDDRTTLVQVTLDVDGNVVDLALQQPSGAVPLDEEALRAFREAGPFPHPPRALFQGNDRFSFLFGFNVVYHRARLDLDWRPY